MAIAQDRHTVGDGQHLGQLVGDEDDGPTGRRHIAHAREQLVGLLRGQYRGRLVEYQDPGPTAEGFQYLDTLAFAQGQLPNPRPGIHRHLETLGRLGDRPFDGAGRETKLSWRGTAEHDVLRHGHALHEAEVLVDHEDTRTLGVSGGVEPYGLAPDDEPAVIGTVEAHQQVAEGGLPGPVLPEQRMHLALGRVERHMVVGDYSRETLCHLDGLYRKRLRHTSDGAGGQVRRQDGRRG